MSEQIVVPTLSTHPPAGATSDGRQFFDAISTSWALAEGPKLPATMCQEPWDKQATDATPRLHPPAAADCSRGCQTVDKSHGHISSVGDAFRSPGDYVARARAGRQGM
eukprot:55943-Pyramimonas_sp.AAC.1